jgi:hypothetical protein
MDKKYDSEMFRLASVLYADNTYDIKPRNIKRKILESIFIDNNNKQLNIHDILDIIESRYKLIFDITEIEDVVKKENESKFYINYNKDSELLISLTPPRFKYLKENTAAKSIDFHLDRFIELKGSSYKDIEIKQIVLKYLYDIFDNNIESFIKLLHTKNASSDTLKELKYPAEHIDIINDFLKWDDNDKNKAIFDILSYSLEYCLISNKGNKTNIKLDYLKNKIFYIDTNVIYRALGINGENRKRRTVTLLNKLNEVGNKIVISKVTEYEFKDSIKYGIGLLNKYNPRKIDSRIFKKVKAQYSIIDFYYKWRLDKTNFNIDVFHADLMTRYEKLKKEFSICMDLDIGFNFDEIKNYHPIELLATDISAFKEVDKSNGKDQLRNYNPDATNYFDAANLHIIEKRRGKVSSNIIDCKYFLMSTDQSLHRWDIKRSRTPIVILPSQWLSIILRYVKRSSDDFSSFVSFLNIHHDSALISSDKLNVILTGISEITPEYDQQNIIFESLIEHKFQDIINNQADTYDVILEKAKDYSKKKLHENLKEAEINKATIAENFKNYKDTSEKKIAELEFIKKGDDKDKDFFKERYNQEYQKNLQNYVNKKMKYWKWIGIISLGYSIFLIISLIMALLPDFSLNYMNTFIKWVDSLGQTFKKEIVNGIFTFLFSGTLLTSIAFSIRILFIKKIKNSKINDYSEEYLKLNPKI